MQFYYLFDNCQSKTAALDAHFLRFAATEKSLEEMANLMCRDTYAGILRRY